VKPGGRHPWSAHVTQTEYSRGRPLSRPLRLTMTSVEKLFWQAAQIATSALFSFAFSLGIVYLV
jgi:hypothetical protein